MNLFRFENPQLLYLLALIPLLVVLYILSYRKKKKDLKKFGDLEIISQLMPFASFNRHIYKFVL